MGFRVLKKGITYKNRRKIMNGALFLIKRIKYEDIRLNEKI